MSKRTQTVAVETPDLPTLAPVAPVTAADLHAPETREPTAEEIAETSAVQNANAQHCDTLQGRAAANAVKAFGNAQSFAFDNMVTLSLTLVTEQIRAFLTERDYEEKTDVAVFRRDFLTPVAMAGGMIYRDTADKADGFALRAADNAKLRGNARKDADAALRADVKAYVQTKGGKYAQGIAVARTYAFALATYMRKEGQSAIIEAAKAPSMDVAEAGWRRAIEALAGGAQDPSKASMAKLTGFLDAYREGTNKVRSAERKAKAEADKVAAAAVEAGPQADALDLGETIRAERTGPETVAAIMGMVEGLSDADFSSLLFRMKEEAEARDTRRTAETVPALPAAVETVEALAA